MISGIVTAVLLALFVCGWAWVWRPECKPEFDEAAQLPLSDGESAR
jgi:cytochrome c oxidase cbb3-type subunit 4